MKKEIDLELIRLFEAQTTPDYPGAMPTEMVAGFEDYFEAYRLLRKSTQETYKANMVAYEAIYNDESHPKHEAYKRVFDLCYKETEVIVDKSKRVFSSRD